MTLLLRLWQDYLIHIIDILLVAYIIYHVLLLIQGTRAIQVLRGLVVLAVATFVVQRILRLPTLGWLLHTFWLGWAMILAVVFQPELRSLLAQLGSQRLGRLLLPQELNFVDEIIAALKASSENRTGMLIVLEQETGLRNFIESGTLINGELSRDLLLSIFQPRSPLHDGAVIVREDRLVAAGCVLPLSHDPGISKILGMRHRAAIGMTEMSDAVVLVVSEETGVVSVARDGRLDRNVDLNDLRDKLRDFYKSMGERGLIRRSGPRKI
jgi:diadenylate cyclase